MDVGIGRTHPLLDTLAQVRDTSSSVHPLERLLEGVSEPAQADGLLQGLAGRHHAWSPLLRLWDQQFLASCILIDGMNPGNNTFILSGSPSFEQCR